jgi:hypothetical protein
VRTRPIIAALAACALLVLAPAPTLAHHEPGPCDLHRWPEESVTRYSKRLIRCAAETWTVKGGARRAICIADRESNLIPTAVGHGATTDYLGLYQHMATDWKRRYTTWTDPDWALSTDALDGRSNAIVTMRMVHAAGSWKAAGWPRFDC